MTGKFGMSGSFNQDSFLLAPERGFLFGKRSGGGYHDWPMEVQARNNQQSNSQDRLSIGEESRTNTVLVFHTCASITIDWLAPELPVSMTIGIVQWIG